MPSLRPSTPLRLLGCSLLVVLLANVAPPRGGYEAAPAPADTTRPWQWPERAENLKVLPEHTTAQELQRTMVGFAGALGVRCHHCHVGEEGRPFEEWDFASDEKPAKETARVMMRMVQAINETHLAELDVPEGAAGRERVAVGCVTCHHGQPRPVLLEDLLGEVFEAEGLDAALARYDALRQRFYGGFTYNFKAPALDNLAGRLLSADQFDAALAFLERNAEHNPGSGRTHRLFAETYLQKGDTTNAVVHLNRAIEIEPQNPAARQRLHEISGQ